MNFFEKRKCKKLLRDLDFHFAGRCLIDQYQDGVIENGLADLFDEYLSNPCLETALKIIEFKPALLFFFAQCKPDGVLFMQNEFRKGNAG